MLNEYTCSVKPLSTDDAGNTSGEIHMMQMKASAVMELTFWRTEF